MIFHYIYIYMIYNLIEYKLSNFFYPIIYLPQKLKNKWTHDEKLDSN